MISNLPPRLNRAFAELEFDLWEAVVGREIIVPCEFKFGFHVSSQGVAQAPLEETVEVTVSIKKVS